MKWYDQVRTEVRKKFRAQMKRCWVWVGLGEVAFEHDGDVMYIENSGARHAKSMNEGLEGVPPRTTS